MSDSPVHGQALRLAMLRASGLLDTPPEESFDRLTQLVARFLNVPVALVTLIDANRQFFVSCTGLEDPWKSDRETPFTHSFCQYVVSLGEALVVEDARVHPLVGENLAIRDLGVIAYAGMPLRMSNGVVLGSFCAIDHKPRKWTPADLDALQTLADAAVAELELRISTRELAEREARFRGALENVRALAVTLDPAGRITFVNDYLVELTEWSRDELVGASWFDTLVPVAQRDERRRTFGSGAREIAPHNLAEICTRSGEHRLISWDNTLLHDAAGDPAGIAAIGHDITVQEQAARLKEELIGVVSHELRGPLTAMRGGLKLMSPHVGKLDEQSRRLFDMAVRNGDRMMRMVNDLLDLERIDSGTTHTTRETVRLAQLLEDAKDSTQATADAAGVEVDIHADDSTLDGDPDRLVQVLGNLIGNALKFSPAASAIQVNAVTDGDDAHFTIRDHGRGIPADQLERIFERFAQVEANDAKKKGGAGLGLSICRAIVEQHGGRIWAESEPGDGATFHFTIPRSSPSPCPAPAAVNT